MSADLGSCIPHGRSKSKSSRAQPLTQTVRDSSGESRSGSDSDSSDLVLLVLVCTRSILKSPRPLVRVVIFLATSPPPATPKIVVAAGIISKVAATEARVPIPVNVAIPPTIAGAASPPVIANTVPAAIPAPAILRLLVTC